MRIFRFGGGKKQFIPEGTQFKANSSVWFLSKFHVGAILDIQLAFIFGLDGDVLEFPSLREGDSACRAGFNFNVLQMKGFYYGFLCAGDG